MAIRLLSDCYLLAILWFFGLDSMPALNEFNKRSINYRQTAGQIIKPDKKPEKVFTPNLISVPNLAKRGF